MAAADDFVMTIIAASLGRSLRSKRDGHLDVTVDNVRLLESVKALTEVACDRVLQARLSQHP